MLRLLQPAQRVAPFGGAGGSGRRADLYAALAGTQLFQLAHATLLTPRLILALTDAIHRLRLVADGSGSPAVCISVCCTSQAISLAVACLADSALAFSARPSRSALSVHLAISEGPTVSSVSPGSFSLRA